MWYAQFSKREFLEFWIGVSKTIRVKSERVSEVTFERSKSSIIHAYWQNEPSDTYHFPSILVFPDIDSNELFAAVNASPQALTPLSAFCRVYTYSEAESYFTTAPSELVCDLLPAIVSLSMAEAIIHSEGKLTWRAMSPAACKRTLSYAWGKALVAGAPSIAIEKLPGRWLDTYSLINSQGTFEPARHVISNVVSTLNVYAQIALGLSTSSKMGDLAIAIFKKDRFLVSECWKSISKESGIEFSLNDLSSSTREERAGYLQLALRQASKSQNDELASVASAFIATQVAPGSLEHLDLLRVTGNPSIVFWYALFAALQAPNEIMAGQGGLGYRILRDIAKNEEFFSEPLADIAFGELKAMERSGIEGFARKFGHTNEIEVELIPSVTSSFTFYSKGSKNARSDSTYPLLSENELNHASKLNLPKTQLEQVIFTLMNIVRELPDDDRPFPSTSGKKTTKKRYD